MFVPRPVPVPVKKMRQVGTLVDLVASMPKKDPRYALFLGAGASVSSGIPTAGRLIALWQRRVFLDETGHQTWRPHYDGEFRDWIATSYTRWRDAWEESYGQHPSDYSLLFSYVCPDADARQGFIERIIAGCEPGPGYVYLAALTLAGYFQTFLTTNFDDLIHDALFRYAGLKPMVCAFDSQVSSIRLQSPRPKIIKLHGDFLFNNMKNVGAEIASLDQNMQDKFERTCESYGLIVVGYSGQDQSVMAPIRSMLHQRDRLTHGVHWCVYGDPRKKNELERWIPEELHRLWTSYPRKVHLYDVGTFDDVMEAFYFGSRCPPPPELAQPQDKALYARLRDGLENADQSWRLGRRFSKLLADFRHAATLPPSEVHVLLDDADEQHRQGLARIKLKEWPEARRSFEMAVALAKRAIAQATPIQKVRAYRRFAGSSSNVSEIIVRSQGLASTAGLPPAALDEIRKLNVDALKEDRLGIQMDADLSSPPELHGHRLNLWFNGLTSYGYLVDLGEVLTSEELAEALAWLEAMAGDEVFGDEYIGLLSNEIGGQKLLDMLRQRSRETTSMRPPSGG